MKNERRKEGRRQIEINSNLGSISFDPSQQPYGNLTTITTTKPFVRMIGLHFNAPVLKAYVCFNIPNQLRCYIWYIVNYIQLNQSSFLLIDYDFGMCETSNQVVYLSYPTPGLQGQRYNLPEDVDGQNT